MSAVDEKIDIAATALIAALLNPDSRERERSFAAVMNAVRAAGGLVEQADGKTLVRGDVGQLIMQKVIMASEKLLVARIGPSLPTEGRDAGFRDAAIVLVDLLIARRVPDWPAPAPRLH